MMYDSVISIGGACEVAHQLRQFTGNHSANLFDWWITPFNGLVNVIENDFEGLLLQQNMTVVSRRSVACSRYGIVHHHDFRRDSEGFIVREEIPSRVVELNSKHTMLVSRFRRSLSETRRILLVRGWLDKLHEKRSSAQRGSLDHDFERLISAVRTRFPEANVSFLFVNYNTSDYVGDNVFFDDVHDYDDKVDWRGSTRGWHEMLSKHVTI
ncbi:MAG: DUF1796 family putative cysteine peptidase [Methylobacterium frigidaeris]